MQPTLSPTQKSIVRRMVCLFFSPYSCGSFQDNASYNIFNRIISLYTFFRNRTVCLYFFIVSDLSKFVIDNFPSKRQNAPYPVIKKKKKKLHKTDNYCVVTEYRHKLCQADTGLCVCGCVDSVEHYIRVLLKTEKDLCHRKEHLGTEKDFYLPVYTIKMYVKDKYD